MLYDRWRQIAQTFGSEIALVDFDSGDRWTFEELARTVEARPSASSAVSFPTGLSPSFIFEVLRGWRDGKVVCPLEAGQTPPPLGRLPEGCVHLKHTSATTGSPRLIAMSAQQLAADADQIVSTMGLRHDWPNFGVISLAHSYGFSNLVLPLLLRGVPLWLAGSPLPETLRRAAGLTMPITLASVPALWRAWFDAGTIPENVRLAISAGAPLPLSLEEQIFERTGIKIHNFYGASECGGIAYDRTETPRQDGGCVGSPMKHVHVSLSADGCLCVCSLAVGMTYWPEASANLGEGCYQSCDLARIEGDLIHLHGRQTDEINVAGRKFSPEIIEQALAGHPAVRECLVFGAPSADLGRTEVIVACLATRTALKPEVLKQHLLQILPAWQVPRAWWFVPDLNPDVRGKLSRSEWRARYLRRISRGTPDPVGGTSVNDAD